MRHHLVRRAEVSGLCCPVQNAVISVTLLAMLKILLERLLLAHTLVSVTDNVVHCNK